LRETVRVQGAGRTDAGVHALGQVASCTCAGDLPAVLRSVNVALPEDVVVLAAERACEGFHARRDAVRRHYRYRLHRGPVALERNRCLPVHPFPDPERMREGARYLLGRHDFTSFASSVAAGERTDCVLERLDIIEEGGFLLVEATANRFLRKMVRTIVGSLLEVGWGKRPPEWLGEVLAARNRRVAGPVVAAKGLFLVAVDYPENLFGEGGGKR
jgi:tRNA pseudouridine38-40 synthase